MNLKKLFRPKSLAVVGGYWTDFVIQGNRKLGFKGPIWHINPTRTSNKKNKYYKNIKDLPGVPDCVYIAVSRDLTVNIIKDFASLRTGGAVCLASRFSETNSKEGLLKTKQLIKNAGAMPFLGPNCYGFINYLDKVSVWSDQIAGNPSKNGIALICQSGTIGNTISFNQRSLSIGYIISVGNQTCVSIEDSIEYVLNDKRVTAIGIYAESFNNIELFYKVLEKAKNKNIPVAIVKVGRSKIASETIMSHTGSLSGKEDIYDAIFKQLGATRCNTLAELCETLKLFHTIGVLKGNKIAIMGPSGGDMAMAGDKSEGLAINYSPIPKKIVKNLEKVNHKGVIISNPFDLQTYNWNDPKSLRKTFDLMFKANFDLIGLMLDFPNVEDCDITEWEDIVDEYILSAKLKKKRAAIIASLPETLPKHIRDKCLKSGIVPLQGLKESLYAIHCSILTGQAWSKFNLLKVFKSNNKIRSLKKTYSEYQSKKILRGYGIGIPKSILSNIKQAVEKMIQDQVTEMIIGIKIDDQFGPVIIVGAGGIYTELMNDSVTLLLPLKKSIILKAINDLKISKLLNGLRGKPEGDIQAIVQAIMKLGKFAEKNASRLIEADINPLIVRPKGKGVIAADALIHYLEDIK